VVGAGGLREIAGVDALQADMEVVFEVPESLDDAEELDHEWLQHDPHKLRACAEKNASSPGLLAVEDAAHRVVVGRGRGKEEPSTAERRESR
jgi:hypothetical protein